MSSMLHEVKTLNLGVKANIQALDCKAKAVYFGLKTKV